MVKKMPPPSLPIAVFPTTQSVLSHSASASQIRMAVEIYHTTFTTITAVYKMPTLQGNKNVRHRANKSR